MSETSIAARAKPRTSARMAGDWWDPDGASAMLHKLNPVRLEYIRDQIDQHWQVDECALPPARRARPRSTSAAARACWPSRWRGLARQVTAIDAAPEADRRGAATMPRRRGWRSIIAPAAVEDLDGTFDLVTALEVIEHVADPQAFVARARGAARARRAADPVDPQPHRLVEAADDHAGRRARADSQGHARLRQVHHARTN